MENKEPILEGVLEEFGKLSVIPRPSGHEKKISDFLKHYLMNLGLHVVQDERFNIIADKPATKGCEDSARIILQSHMDMVCVAENGVLYDALKDSIQVVRKDGYLSAKGTSLGADDGIGIAEILYILKNLKEHGPLRAIFTVDEEQGMSGAEYLHEKYLLDAEYLLNCDSEDYDVLTVGSAGNVTIDFNRSIHFVPATCPSAYRICVDGLKGGHSGERIGDGRGNAIRTLALAILALQKEGNVELRFAEGGTARNAIPSEASAVIQTDLSEKTIKRILEGQETRFHEMYGIADCVKISVFPEKEVSEVFAKEDMNQLLQLLTILHTGVYSMSPLNPELVETSANLGTVQMEQERMTVSFLPRSAVDQKIEEFCQLAETVGEMAGFEVSISGKSHGWKGNPNSRLAKLMPKIFQEQTGREMIVKTIHAGLECGWHYKKNPKLDIVSIGVTTKDIHTPKERLFLSTVKPQVELIMETIRRLSKHGLEHV